MSSTFLTPPNEAIFSNPSNATYLAEVIFYVIALAYAAIILKVQGRKNAEGWVTLLMFAVSLILSAIALGPLELCALAFLNRGSEVSKQATGQGSINKVWRMAIRAGVALATVFSIVGNLKLSKGNDTSTAILLIKVSGIVFLLTFLMIMATGVRCYSMVGESYSSDYIHYIYALLVATPFYLVRIAFAIASGFSTSGTLETYHTFSSFNGDWRIKLGMAVITEFVVDIIYCIAGYSIELRNRRQRAPQEMVSPPGDVYEYYKN